MNISDVKLNDEKVANCVKVTLNMGVPSDEAGRQNATVPNLASLEIVRDASIDPDSLMFNLTVDGSDIGESQFKINTAVNGEEVFEGTIEDATCKLWRISQVRGGAAEEKVVVVVRKLCLEVGGTPVEFERKLV